VPVRVVSDTLVQITLANGVQLQLPLNSNVEQLARLVKAVAAHPKQLANCRSRGGRKRRETSLPHAVMNTPLCTI
jgi:hypothetical protein